MTKYDFDFHRMLAGDNFDNIEQLMQEIKKVFLSKDFSLFIHSNESQKTYY